jgi:hypothetical protein
VQTFTRELDTAKPPSQVLSEAVTTLTGPLANFNYTLQTQTENALTFVRRYRPWFIWVGVVIFFPLGLLLLLYRDTATITVALEPADGGTRIRVAGKGEENVRQAFERLQV